MNEFYAGPLSVDDIAAVAGLSQYHFNADVPRQNGPDRPWLSDAASHQRAKDLLQKAMARRSRKCSRFLRPKPSYNQFKANLGVTPRQFALACR